MRAPAVESPGRRLGRWLGTEWGLTPGGAGRGPLSFWRPPGGLHPETPRGRGGGVSWVLEDPGPWVPGHPQRGEQWRQQGGLAGVAAQGAGPSYREKKGVSSLGPDTGPFSGACEPLLGPGPPSFGH